MRTPEELHQIFHDMCVALDKHHLTSGDTVQLAANLFAGVAGTAKPKEEYFDMWKYFGSTVNKCVSGPALVTMIG